MDRDSDRFSQTRVFNSMNIRVAFQQEENSIFDFGVTKGPTSTNENQGLCLQKQF